MNYKWYLCYLPEQCTEEQEGIDTTFSIKANIVREGENFFVMVKLQGIYDNLVIKKMDNRFF